MKTPYLVGERVYLRPLNRDDASVLQRQINNPEVVRTLMVWRPMSLEAETAFIERIAQSETDVVLAIALREDDRMIGDAGLHQIDWRSRVAEFGIQIGDSVDWGKGYGTEVTRLVVRYGFESLNLNRIWLRVYDHHPGGIRAYEKAGFRREGVMRQGVWREGAFHDVIVMAILASEWKVAAGK